MVALESTWDTVLMLLIAAGVGLIGGIGGALLEMRRSEAEQAKFWPGLSSIILGGIAAVAILYFFPPQETVKEGTEVVTQYNLAKLVALALIVGSAGSSILVALQARTTAALNEKRANSVIGAGTASVEKLGVQAPVMAKAGVEAAAPTIQDALEKATAMAPAEITPEKVKEVIDDVADRTIKTVQEQMAPAVEGATETINAAADSGELKPDAVVVEKAVTPEPDPVIP
jgi:DNA-binding transcriptional regulator YdaS (Cro superfamily)